MSARLELVSVNVSRVKGTVKTPVEQVAVGPEGVVGDAHAGRWPRQVSLLAEASIERFAGELGRPIAPGEFAENLTVRGLEAADVGLLDRFRFGEVELEVTQIGKECHGEGCSIFREVGRCVMPIEGLFARVVRGGMLRAGMPGEHLRRTLRIVLLTLSDRAAAGEYADRAGPRAKELLQAWLAENRWEGIIETQLLPDDAERLRAALLAARESGVDLVVTTGGTGVGPRDVTPETVAALCDRQIPGIMEHIRAKYGAANPRARLSRSIAGLSGTMQIYTLPGSVRAVDEYLSEILATLEHVIFMIRGLDAH